MDSDCLGRQMKSGPTADGLVRRVVCKPPMVTRVLFLDPNTHLTISQTVRGRPCSSSTTLCPTKACERRLMAPFSTASNATPSRSSPALVAPTPTLLNEPSPRTSDLDSSPTLARSEGASLHRVGDDDGPIRKVDEDDPVDVKDRPRSTSSADGEPKVDVGRGAHMRGGDVQMSLPKNSQSKSSICSLVSLLSG